MEDEELLRLPVRIRKSSPQAGLYLFQYPLRPYWRPYNTSSLEAARVRPLHRQAELTLGVDEGAHYDEDSPSPLTNIRLSSTTNAPKTSYAIGMLSSAEEIGAPPTLTLVPLECCMQLRPSFQVIDEQSAQHAAPAAARESSAPEEGESNGGPSSFAPVFRPAQTEKEIEARRNSHAYMIEQQEAEEWCKATIFAAESDESTAVCDRIFDLNPKPSPMIEG